MLCCTVLLGRPSVREGLVDFRGRLVVRGIHHRVEAQEAARALRQVLKLGARDPDRDFRAEEPAAAVPYHDHRAWSVRTVRRAAVKAANDGSSSPGGNIGRALAALGLKRDEKDATSTP